MNVRHAVLQASALLASAMAALDKDPNAGEAQISLPPNSVTQPPITQVVDGGDLTGTNGNPKLVTLGDGACAAYRYDFRNVRAFEFKSGTQTGNASPPYAWVWLSTSPAGTPINDPAIYFMGQGVAGVAVSAEQAEVLRSKGIDAVYYNEQVVGASANRFAEVITS